MITGETKDHLVALDAVFGTSRVQETFDVVSTLRVHRDTNVDKSVLIEWLIYTFTGHWQPRNVETL